MAVIKALHAAGKRYEWSVTEPDVHICGNTAWIAYVNQGAITDASGTVRQKMARIGLSPETGGLLEDRLHAQHVRPCGASTESREIT